MLVGAVPPLAMVCVSSMRSVATAKVLTSELPALVTSRVAPSPARTTEPWEVRCGTPVPAPPVGWEPRETSEPSGLRRKATMRLRSASLDCTKTPETSVDMGCSLVGSNTDSPPSAHAPYRYRDVHHVNQLP